MESRSRRAVTCAMAGLAAVVLSTALLAANDRSWSESILLPSITSGKAQSYRTRHTETLNLTDTAVPVAVDVSPDGTFWLALVEPEGIRSWVHRFSADLQFDSRWQVDGRIQDLTAAVDGSLYVSTAISATNSSQQSRILRLSAAGHRLAYNTKTYAVSDALTAFEGGVWELGRAAPGVTTTLRALSLDPDTQDLRETDTIDQRYGRDIAACGDGESLVMLDAFGTSLRSGRLLRLDRSGSTIAEIPVVNAVAVDCAPTHLALPDQAEAAAVWVAHSSRDSFVTGEGSVSIRRSSGETLSTIGFMAEPIDLASGPDAQTYVLVERSVEQQAGFCLLRYELPNRLLDTNCELGLAQTPDDPSPTSTVNANPGPSTGTAAPTSTMPPFPIAKPTRIPPPSQPQALALLRRSDAVMNRWQGGNIAWIRDNTGDGDFAYFQAPDRVYRGRHRDGRQVETAIQMGSHRWSRPGADGRGAWTFERAVQPLQWPRFQRSAPLVVGSAGPAFNLRFDGEETVGSTQAFRLRYERSSLRREGWIREFWTEWIDMESAVLLKAEMVDYDSWGAPGLVARYGFLELDPPPNIHAPAPASFGAFRLYLPAIGPEFER